MYSGGENKNISSKCICGFANNPATPPTAALKISSAVKRKLRTHHCKLTSTTTTSTASLAEAAPRSDGNGGGYFKDGRQDLNHNYLMAVGGFQTLPTNSGSEVDDSEVMGSEFAMESSNGLGYPPIITLGVNNNTNSLFT
ncbi:hypothetical protein KY290_007677 [Solanum tuberosum]|uniref:Uncharacterized protein n=1 Tax=Solanum tuberosum TaxID=4113 RepID=A0ABQ7W7K8_SOLTU|nr:hypothetical protein KY290_007677 [Solanum tuberosum]